MEQLFGYYSIANVPRGLWYVVLEGQRQIIPARTAISMRKAGVIDSARMNEIIQAAGYSLADAALLIKYAEVEDAAPPKQAADALHGLTQSTVLNLYESGTIEQTVALDLLVQIGIGRDAAELAVMLVELRVQQDERKATTDRVIAQVTAGELSVDDAQGVLAAEGLTTVEMEKAYAAILRGQKGKSKMPGLADLGKMWKRGIIEDAEYLNTVVQLGYSAFWAGRLFEILKGGDEPQGG